ncbi:MAG: hypothetical protein ABIA78_01970 [archaeon]
MRKIIILSIFAILLMSFASADIIINQQPKEVYNLGDTLNIPVTIKSLSDVSGNFKMFLLCAGKEVNFYLNGVRLLYGQEKTMDASLVLTKDIIGQTIGTCKIRAEFVDEDPQITKEFKISNSLTLSITSQKTEFAPEQSILIEGEAIKENGETVNGFININVMSGNTSSSLDQLGTINNGYFSANFTAPKDMKAGQYRVTLNAYERDFLGEETNKGYTEQTISIIQVPTSLEIVFEEQQVEPGTNLKIKTILHDQTGEKISTISSIKIIDRTGLVLDQIEKQTDDFLEFPIIYKEPPANWTIIANSEGLTTESTFIIKEKKEVKTELINKSLMITNIGNVFYNDTVLVKIGNQSLNLNVSLEIDENKKYVLTAPDGEYGVEVLVDGESQINENAILTGKIISVKEASESIIKVMRYPIVWVFIIAILGFIAFMIFRKGYKRSFFGRIPSILKKPGQKTIHQKKDSIIKIRNPAELSLSLKGDKQSATLLCLKLKNFTEIKSEKGNAKDTLQKIAELAEENKTVIYENTDNLFFIFAPIKTKTFGNENSAISLAQKIKDILLNHNQSSKQKINFGISLNNGTIIAKQESGILKFISMGTFITTAKKIASLAEKDILLSDKIKDKLGSTIKTQKQNKNGIEVYSVKEIKNSEEHKKFIRNFLDRLESKK